MKRFVIAMVVLVGAQLAAPSAQPAEPSAQLAPPAAAAGRTLDIYFIDVEGGQATLIVTPAHESLLIDGGWAGFEGRDPQRVLAAAHDAGLDHIDYEVATHFHGDHVGAIPGIAKLIPIRTFVDYDKPFDKLANVVVPFTAYAVARETGKHLVPVPGDPIPMKGVDVTVITTGGESIAKPLATGGAANPACASLEKWGDDPGENRRSVGITLAFGAFRFIDLGDLNWNPLVHLVCPNNLIGTASVVLVPHHSNSDAGVPALFTAVAARAVISNNGATKGGAADTLATLHAPGVGEVWQLHRSMRDGAQNFAEARIANLDEGETGFWIKVSAAADGRFTVTNARNGFSRTYSGGGRLQPDQR
jgi:beta-lactamase superfamily II metal-dependent hydrolase